MAGGDGGGGPHSHDVAAARTLVWATHPEGATPTQPRRRRTTPVHRLSHCRIGCSSRAYNTDLEAAKPTATPPPRTTDAGAEAMVFERL